ncbi:MAG: guanylate kinase [Candidatus Caldarchaeum sp.]
MKGLLVILSGPSASGKDTVIQEWKNIDERVRKIVTCTTRKPRHGEQDGVDYVFLTPEAFQKGIEENLFLEYKNVHGYLYGTPIADVEKALHEGCIVVLKIDVQGGMEVKHKRPDALSIFLKPPSIQELERRMRTRGLNNEIEIQRRLQDAEGELARAPYYDYIVINDDAKRAAQEISNIVRKHLNQREQTS